MPSPRTPSKLRRQADRLDREAAELRASGRALGAEYGREPLGRQAHAKEAKAARLRAQAARMDGRLTVSDHALVRYLERAYGLDVEALRAALAPPALRAVVAAVGDGQYPVETAAGTHYAVVEGGCVVTVLTS